MIFGRRKTSILPENNKEVNGKFVDILENLEKRIFYLVLVVVFSIFLIHTQADDKRTVKRDLKWSLLPQNFTLLNVNNMISPKALTTLQLYNIKDDPYFIVNQHNLKQWLPKIQEFHDNSSKYQIELMNIPFQGIKCFSKFNVSTQTVIGDFLGLITDKISVDNQYSRPYLPQRTLFDKNHPLRDLVINSQYYGDGWMRFIRTGANPNVEIIHVPVLQKQILTWHIIYISIRDIFPGEELTIKHMN
jgi:hypothetical protein